MSFKFNTQGFHIVISQVNFLLSGSCFLKQLIHFILLTQSLSNTRLGTNGNAMFVGTYNCVFVLDDTYKYGVYSYN